jgi:hypothetical protein
MLIHIIGEDGDVEVWLDTEVEECDGIVIGLGATRINALDSARAELQARLRDVEELMREEDRVVRSGAHP